MNNDFLELYREHLSPALTRATQLVFEKGEGPYLYTTDGKRYLDFVSGIAVNQLGHCHPKVVAAAKEQAEKLIHCSLILGSYPSAVRYAKELAKVTPGELNMFFFSNAGTEAVEGALKLARWKTRKPCFIAYQGAFHGRTMGAISVTASSASFRARYAPFLPTIYHVPYPYCYRCLYGGQPETCSLDCLEEINRLFKYQTTPADVAAVLIEPVLGEGGYIVPPVRYMKGLEQLCRDHDILLIFDEVQTGFGRTGKMFAAEHFNIVPDIICLAKGMASGFPLAAVAASKEFMGDWTEGAHGTTFGGNPVSCAAGLALLEVFREENILVKCNERGSYFKKVLQGLKNKYPVIGDVRGLGLMLAVEIVDSKGQPDGETCSRIIAYCAEHGLLLMKCGTFKNCIRFMTPLNISRAALDEGISIFRDALKSVS